MGKKLMFEGDWARLRQNVACSDNQGKNIWNKIEKPVNSSRTRKF